MSDDVWDVQQQDSFYFFFYHLVQSNETQVNVLSFYLEFFVFSLIHLVDNT